MELIQVGKRTYYIKNPTNIGVYQISDTEVYLIDTGNDKEAGKKILKLIQAEGWTVRGIISTHANADHIGGNKVIQDRTGCPVYAYGMEACVTAFPLLEPSLLYGGYPFKPLRNKFLMAKASAVTAMDDHLPEGLTDFSLPGHYLDMIGIKTDEYKESVPLCRGQGKIAQGRANGPGSQKKGQSYEKNSEFILGGADAAGYGAVAGVC